MNRPAALAILAAAFPRKLRAYASVAADQLATGLADDARLRTIIVLLDGEELAIPRRLHLSDDAPRPVPGDDVAGLMVRCLLTRSADGHERQAAVRNLAGVRTAWAAPFLLLLAGDHVAEVAMEARRALPSVESGTWRSLVQENRPLLRDLHARATRHSDRPSPGTALLRELERLAA